MTTARPVRQLGQGGADVDAGSGGADDREDATTVLTGALILAMGRRGFDAASWSARLRRGHWLRASCFAADESEPSARLCSMIAVMRIDTRTPGMTAPSLAA